MFWKFCKIVILSKHIDPQYIRKQQKFFGENYGWLIDVTATVALMIACQKFIS